jgi:hypothetical protein
MLIKINFIRQGGEVMDLLKRDWFKSDKAIPYDLSAQGQQLTDFFRYLLIINVVFFFLQNMSEIILMFMYVNYSDTDFIIKVDLIWEKALMLIEAIVFSFFYYLEIRKNVHDKNFRIIRIWVFSYIILSFFWIIFIDFIRSTVFYHKENTAEYITFMDYLPYLYIIFSAAIITITIYRTSKYLKLKWVMISAAVYPIFSFIILLLRYLDIIYGPKTTYFLYKIDIAASLYDVQYIIWLYLLYRNIKNIYLLHDFEESQN